jgi:hypothetical protein
MKGSPDGGARSTVLAADSSKKKLAELSLCQAAKIHDYFITARTRTRRTSRLLHRRGIYNFSYYRVLHSAMSCRQQVRVQGARLECARCWNTQQTWHTLRCCFARETISMKSLDCVGATNKLFLDQDTLPWSCSSNRGRSRARHGGAKQGLKKERRNIT